MSNTIRPWFRLSSIARPTPQGSTEPVQPRPAAPRGSARVARPVVAPPPPPPPPQRPAPPARDPSPSPPRVPSPTPRAPSPSPPPSPPKPAAQLSPPPPPSPKSPPMRPLSPKDVKEALVRIGEPPRKPLSPPEYPSMVRKPSPDPSLRSVKPEPQTPPGTPKPRTPSPKLSPHSLPPSQLRSLTEDDTTQKKVLTAEKASQAHGLKEHHHAGKTKKILPSDSEDMSTRVITIAGENKGAVMEILRSPKNGDPKHLKGTGQSRTLKSGSSSSSDEGEGKKTKNKGKMMNSNGTLPLKAFMNSNVQMINNSIVYNSSATHHDPGVHLSLSRKPGNGFHVKEYGKGYTS